LCVNDTVHVFTSIYHPTYGLRDTPFMTFINCYMFRHRDLSVPKRVRVGVCHKWCITSVSRSAYVGWYTEVPRNLPRVVRDIIKNT